jgi:O-antigen ligase
MIVGVIYTKSKYNWLDWIFILFLLIFLYSIPLFNFSIGFLRTGTSFQGITNQPNMLGVIMVLFSSIIFSKLSVAKRKWYLWMILIFVFVQIYFTYSRTSMFSFLILLIVFLYFNLNIQKKFLYVIIFGVFLLFISVFQINIYSQIIEYVYKGQDFILESRFNQVEDLIFNFRKNPIFGTGFSVPHVMQRSYEFNFSYIVEPGNLILAVLSYGGLIGLILFIYAMLKIYLANKYNMHIYIYVFISTLLVSMGELVFFSTNNIAILLYLQIAIYIVSNHNFIKRRDKDVM